jgi:hypothetical protein
MTLFGSSHLHQTPSPFLSHQMSEHKLIMIQANVEMMQGIIL